MVERVGRTRRKLAVLLQAKADELFGAGHFCVCPEDIEMNQLTYRTKFYDCIVWEVYLKADTPPFRARFYSWDTMGSCCKHGVGVVGEPDHLGAVEISADERCNSGQ